jgi:DNA polymerase III subunit epsilon
METLQQRLRQLRSQQQKTLYDAAKLAPGMRIETLCKLEQGDHSALRAQLSPLSKWDKTCEHTAAAYGVPMEAWKRLLEDEYAWRISAMDGNASWLPHIARYLYRPLPEVARRFFDARDFVILDLETTGKDPHSPMTEIVEISILNEDGDTLLHTLVRPERVIPPEVTDLHGINDVMVANAPTFCEVFPRIAAAITGKTVVVYKAGYDIYLLDNLIIRNHLTMPEFNSWCLMLAYADYYKAPGRYGGYAWQKLSEACEQQQVQLVDAHRALGDTLATWRLLQALAEKEV